MPEGLNVLSWIVIGLLAGAIAGWFVPGRERNGCIGTTLIGVAGGLIGGWIWTELLDQDQAGLGLADVFEAIQQAGNPEILGKGYEHQPGNASIAGLLGEQSDEHLADPSSLPGIDDRDRNLRFFVVEPDQPANSYGFVAG